MATRLLSAVNFSQLCHHPWIAKAILPSAVALFALPAIAAPLPQGQEYFERAPQLVQVTSHAAQTNGAGHRYELVITVPKDAGAPVQALTITQPANALAIPFQPNATRVWVGHPRTEIPLVNIGGEQAATGELTLALHHPIQPGETATVQLTATRNPSASGVYLLGVTAYPTGENSPGLFLGYGRVNLYGPSGG